MSEVTRQQALGEIDLVEVLNELRDEAHAIAVEHGWWEREDAIAALPGAIEILGPHWYRPEKIALIHSEASEALEDHRNAKDPTLVTFRESDGKPEGIPIEYADVIIRIMDDCGRDGIDIGEAVRLKMAFNRTRPYRHGNKLA